jgi:hypothetical protein
MDYKTLEAHVWEYPGLVGLSAQADWEELLIKSEYVEFLELTHLREYTEFEDIRLPCRAVIARC